MKPAGNQPQTANSGLMFYAADFAGIQDLSLASVCMFAVSCDARPRGWPQRPSMTPAVRLVIADPRIITQSAPFLAGFKAPPRRSFREPIHRRSKRPPWTSLADRKSSVKRMATGMERKLVAHAHQGPLSVSAGAAIPPEQTDLLADRRPVVARSPATICAQSPMDHHAMVSRALCEKTGWCVARPRARAWREVASVGSTDARKLALARISWAQSPWGSW